MYKNVEKFSQKTLLAMKKYAVLENYLKLEVWLDFRKPSHLTTT